MHTYARTYNNLTLQKVSSAAWSEAASTLRTVQRESILLWVWLEADSGEAISTLLRTVQRLTLQGQLGLRQGLLARPSESMFTTA